MSLLLRRRRAFPAHQAKPVVSWSRPAKAKVPLKSGGGEGRAPIGRKKPTTPWGYPVIKEAVPNMPLERSEIVRAVIVRTCKELKRDNDLLQRSLRKSFSNTKIQYLPARPRGIKRSLPVLTWISIYLFYFLATESL